MDPGSSTPQDTDPKYEEQNGDKMVPLGEREIEATGDESLNYDQKMGNQYEAIHSLEGGHKSVARAINGRRDLWAPSQDRESKLDVVRTGPRHDIRAYKGEKKPSRLYEEDEGKLCYELPPEYLSFEKAKELEEERQEIIKSQAMKKSTTTVEKLTSVDEPGAPSPASPGGEKAKIKRRDSMGLAVGFDKPSPGWVKAIIDPENIDTGQINFAAVRQQFLALEKRNPNLLLGPRKQVLSPRFPAIKNIYEREGQGHLGALMVDRDPAGYNQRELGLASEGGAAPVNAPQIGPFSEGRLATYQGFSAENLDWGEMGPDLVTEAPHHGRVFWKKSRDALDLVAGGQDPAEELEARKETPIEREIRLSVEREEALWWERGIQRPSSRDELVVVQSKPLLLSPLLSVSAVARKRRDQARVSFYVQREIEQETKREEDLQKEGRLPGAYDKGTPQDLRELRKVFEGEGTLLPSARKPGHLGEVPESTPDQAAHLRVANAKERIIHQDMNQSLPLAQPSPVPETLLGNEPSQRRQGSSPGPRPLCTKEAAGPGAQPVLRKEHFAVPMQRPKATLPDDQGCRRHARGTEGRPKWAAPKEELYTLKTGKPRISLLIDQEIQEALQREEELQEQRTKERLAMSRDTEKGTEKAFCSHLWSQSAVADPSCVSSSPTFIAGSPTRPPASPAGRFPSEPNSKARYSLKQSQTEEEEKKKKARQREEGKYAGIEPMDEIDTEVVNSTKVVRHRGMRAQLWEAGQIHKRGEEESDLELPLFDF
ncbi:mitotic interactor and substrate of PLK1 isoform X2 [Sphaerodactylus townsendi]|uniref:mitotic interactor and substrate of PLK1 isoform X2 n=1 Tax=Sphaerodactylus townsendi TaxID=933632 RepID=UPI0020265156|nr:mitotic interactor and substrate of PLK1 isoform X2 [Sphaerodactylus townsendi]